MSEYAAWPFRPLRRLSLDEATRWWDNCYLPSAGGALLQEAPHWTILSGGPGSGKSVALQAFIRAHPATFFVSYPPSRWPGGPHTLYPDAADHFSQMMATAALTLRDHFSQHPSSAAALTTFDFEFIRWLFEHYLGPRAYHRLTRALPPEMQRELRGIPREEMFSDTRSPRAVQAQIDELIGLAQALSFERVVFTVDVHHPGTEMEKEGLLDLFGWLELMHHPNFSVVAAVPAALLAGGEVKARARGRVRALHLSWSVAQCRRIAGRHIGQALPETVQLDDLANATLLEKMGGVIEAEFGETAVPTGWVALAESLLFLSCHEQKPTPLGEDDLGDLIRAFFGRHMRLRIDQEAHGVWRGPRFIRLDEQPLNFLALLQRRRGHPINWDDPDLRFLAGSKGNVYSIASRTRKVIEPWPDEPIYLINKRGEGGYWIEKTGS